jgi:hypothetical protein
MVTLRHGGLSSSNLVHVSTFESLPSTSLAEGGGCSQTRYVVGGSGMLGTGGKPRSASPAQQRRRLWAPFSLLGGLDEVPYLHPDLPPGRKLKILWIGRRCVARCVLVGGVT